MLPALCGLFSLLVLPAGNPLEGPSSQVDPPVLRSRQWVIPEVTSAPAQRVRAAPGFATTLRFDTALDPASVVLEHREEFFALWEVGTYTVTVEPRAALPEAGLTLEVGFADGRQPAGASFVLVPATGEVDAQLRVVRPLPSSEPPSPPTKDPRPPYEPGLFARLVLSGRLGLDGITSAQLTHPNDMAGSGEISAEDRFIHRTKTLAVVTMRLRLSAASTQPWVPGEAWLLDSRGNEVGRLQVWMDGTRLEPGGERTVAMEVDLSTTRPSGELRLELREKEGGRTVPAGLLEF